MAKTSKSPKRILQVAHQLGKQRLRTYSHRFSPKKFTLPQLFACMVLKEFLRLDYRKLSALLEDAPSLDGTWLSDTGVTLQSDLAKCVRRASVTPQQANGVGPEVIPTLTWRLVPYRGQVKGY